MGYQWAKMNHPTLILPYLSQARNTANVNQDVHILAFEFRASITPLPVMKPSAATLLIAPATHNNACY
jgi:hypothetical protein